MSCTLEKVRLEIYELANELANLFQSRHQNLIKLLIVINLAGTIYGWYYYRFQLMASNPLFWPLITDCPNATFFFVIVALLIYSKKKNDDFTFFASANMVKYGIWTMAILMYHRDYFFAPERYLLYSGIFVTHFFLVLEAIPLKNTISSISERGLAITFSWLLINDFFDYVVGTHPYIPEKNIRYVAIFTVLLTFTAILLIKFSLKTRNNN